MVQWCNRHIYAIKKNRLPTVLEGHIVPGLTVASLIGIRILCKAGCTVVFTDTACHVVYKGTIILTGYKDSSTDLWILPITSEEIYCQGSTRLDNVTNATKSAQPRASPGMACALQSKHTNIARISNIHTLRAHQSQHS